MMTDTLIYKGYIINGDDLELTFHKDAFLIYNENPFPVVKYALTNCRDLDKVKFDSIDYYNDGLIIDTGQENGVSVFETTDMGNVKIKITCDKIEKEELEYNSQDFIDIIKEILKQGDSEYDTVAILSKRTDNLKQFLNRELDIVTRKLNQADWLTEDKKHFLQGQQEIIKKTLEKIEIK